MVREALVVLREHVGPQAPVAARALLDRVAEPGRRERPDRRVLRACRG
jgi:hypothetical protein